MTLPMLDPASFPAYMAPPPAMYLRTQNAVRWLSSDEPKTFEGMIEAKHSTEVLLAERVLDDLVAAALDSDKASTRQAATVLERWDRRVDAGSEGAVLFAWWVQAWLAGANTDARIQSRFAVPWSPEEPLSTPRGIADPAYAVTALESAIGAVVAAADRMEAAWGDVARLRMGELDLPANGGPDYPMGLLRTVDFAPIEGDPRHFEAHYGDSYVAAVEFSDPVRARVLLSYGNATQPGSPHRGDQLALFADKALRPAWLTRTEIEANLASREALAPD
jgi:acyl-homoserine-lactone acylase